MCLSFDQFKIDKCSIYMISIAYLRIKFNKQFEVFICIFISSLFKLHLAYYKPELGHNISEVNQLKFGLYICLVYRNKRFIILIINIVAYILDRVLKIS